MAQPKYKSVGASTMTPTDDKKRKDVLISPRPHSELLAVFNPVTGEGSELPFALFSRKAVVDKGQTENEGFSPRIFRPKFESMLALIGPKGDWVVEYHDALESPPPCAENETQILDGLEQQGDQA